jgi:hypothetical protein
MNPELNRGMAPPSWDIESPKQRLADPTDKHGDACVSALFFSGYEAIVAGAGGEYPPSPFPQRSE